MIGAWNSSDGGMFLFNENGSFSGKSLPAKYFTYFTSENEVLNKKVNGRGKWKLEKENGFWRIQLEFENIDGRPLAGLYYLLISGQTGILENKPPWYLFVWKDDVGGEKYKFQRE